MSVRPYVLGLAALLVSVLGADRRSHAQRFTLLAPDEWERPLVVEEVSPVEYRISRSVVDQLHARPEALAYLHSHVVAGCFGPYPPPGLKLYDIRRHSLLGRLGIQNGDLIQTVNGIELHLPMRNCWVLAKALEAADSIEVTLTRHRATWHVRYDITD